MSMLASPGYNQGLTHGCKKHLAQRRVHVEEESSCEVVTGKLSKMNLIKPVRREGIPRVTSVDHAMAHGGLHNTVWEVYPPESRQEGQKKKDHPWHVDVHLPRNPGSV